MKNLLLVSLLIFSTMAFSSQTLSAETKVRIETSLGTIEAELNSAKAPLSVKNFLDYVNSGFYNGTIFHRVISNFMIQGGGFLPKMVKKETKAPIKIESKNGLSNEIGTLAMARTNDPNSATSQFFINVVDNSRLDYQGPASPGYTVFGKVTKGMSVVNQIKSVKTITSGMHQNVPFEDVVIKKIEIIK